VAAQFDAARHEPLADKAWDAGVVRAAIERIVSEARAAFTPDGLWPIHPRDIEGDRGPLTSLYDGAAGIIWGLDHLVREGAVSPGETFAEHLPEVQRRNLRVMESDAWRRMLGPAWQTRSWLFGDSGLLFTRWKTASETAVLGVLADAIALNSDDPACELMWGAPGTMLPALALSRSSGESRWSELYLAGAAALEASLTLDGALGADLWTQTLYRRRAQYLGPVHGFAGNAFALIAGRDLLAPDRWAALSARIARTLESAAIRGPAGINWGPLMGWEAMGKILVQHCHGAPGMVTALAGLDAPIDDLLIGGGDLTWNAGPLEKGANLCHGTSGNALAFLKLFVRTGDKLWLTRARAFAMHAIAQSDAEAAQVGQRRFSLWTGDIGLACFLWECLNGTARFPTMDVL
jgi:hypothetical protein